MKTKELEWTGDVERGAKGKKARRVQEWLGLQGVSVAVDEDFGGATEIAVRTFQSRSGLPITGVVDQSTFDRLTAPMRQALIALPPNGRRLGELVVAYGQQHVAQAPREIGGPNMGPWVRLYNGADGKDQLWCAGFVSTLVRQACESLGIDSPIKLSVGCDALAANAKAAERFVAGKDASPTTITPGMIFLLQSKKNAKDWIHTGIVTHVDADAIGTIEGNTDHDGSSNGYEATTRIRGWVRKDFIQI